MYSYLQIILDLRHVHCSMFVRTQCILNDHELLEGTKNRAIICALVASALQQVADVAQFNLVYRHFELCSYLLDRPNDHLVGFITGYALAFMLDTPGSLPHSLLNCAAVVFCIRSVACCAQCLRTATPLLGWLPQGAV